MVVLVLVSIGPAVLFCVSVGGLCMAAGLFAKAWLALHMCMHLVLSAACLQPMFATQVPGFLPVGCSKRVVLLLAAPPAWNALAYYVLCHVGSLLRMLPGIRF